MNKWINIHLVYTRDDKTQNKMAAPMIVEELLVLAHIPVKQKYTHSNYLVIRVTYRRASFARIKNPYNCLQSTQQKIYQIFRIIEYDNSDHRHNWNSPFDGEPTHIPMQHYCQKLSLPVPSQPKLHPPPKQFNCVTKINHNSHRYWTQYCTVKYMQQNRCLGRGASRSSCLVLTFAIDICP